MKTTLLALGLLGATAVAGLAALEDPRRPTSLRINWMRVLARHPDLPVEVEASTRLAVPAAVAEDVWSFLMLQQTVRDAPRVAQVTDWHYDTPSASLAERGIAVRLRTTHDQRPRLQIKAYDANSGHAAELSFDATAAEPAALTDLIAERDRPTFTRVVTLLGIDAHELGPGAPLFHARMRIELERDGTHMRASLDHLTWDGGEHDVLELTPRASESNHRGVTTVSHELRTMFPAVRADPAPKMIAARRRTLPRDDTTCLWSAARLMCRSRTVAAVETPAARAPEAETQAEKAWLYGRTYPKRRQLMRTGPR
jgi:hypothetical protein